MRHSRDVCGYRNVSIAVRRKSGVRRAAVARASILRTRAIPDEVLATCPIETARRSGVRVRAYLRDARAAAEGGGLARLDSDGGGERGDGGHGGGDVNARAWECLARAHWYTSAARKQVSENGYIRILRLETHTIKYLKWSASTIESNMRPRPTREAETMQRAVFQTLSDVRSRERAYARRRGSDAYSATAFLVFVPHAFQSSE